MRSAGRTSLAAIAFVMIASTALWASDPAPAKVRATRRAYDGSPPVIGHANNGAKCESCHIKGGQAPASPHGPDFIRCHQCHVFKVTDKVFKKNNFLGFAQDLRKGPRLYPGAPPVIPHRTWMRETCDACHTGAMARREIRTSHPERQRCRQCHLPQETTAEFHR